MEKKQPTLPKNRTSQPLDYGSKVLQPNFAVPMHEKTYAAIIFDLGRVLIGWEPAVIAEQLYPDTQAALIIQTAVKDAAWLDFDRGTITIAQLASHMAEKYCFDEVFTTQIIITIASRLPELPLMVKALHRAKAQKYKIYLLSNMPAPYYKALVKNYAFFSLCDGIVASYQIQSIKPEPAIYRNLLEKFNINPHAAIFIDDIEENIIAANTFGIDGIVCKNVAEAVHLLEQNNILRKE